MDRDQALDLLPETYGTALRLRGSGAGDREIAAALGIPPEAVDALLRLADAKLDHLLAADAVP